MEMHNSIADLNQSVFQLEAEKNGSSPLTPPRSQAGAWEREGELEAPPRSQAGAWEREGELEAPPRSQAEPGWEREGELEKEVITGMAELQEQLERDRVVNSIAQRIRQSLSLDETLSATVREVRQLLNCDRVLLYRLEPDGTGSVAQEAVVDGFPSIVGRSYPAEVFPLEYQQLYRQGRIRAIDNIKMGDKVAPCMIEFLQEFEAKAKLVVPIIQEKELWGLLIAHQCRSTRHWQTLEINLLEQLATHIAIALKQASLYSQIETELFERKLAEEKVKQLSGNLEEFLSLLCVTLDSTTDGILVVNHQRKIVSFNQRFTEMWGIPESVLESREHDKEVAFIKQQLKDPEGFQEKVNETYRHPWVHSHQVLELKDGRYFERYTQPQRQGEKIVGIAIAFRDITERKLAAAALQNAHDELETKVDERTAQLRQANEQLRNEIVERQWSEKARRESEERFRNLVETTSDWIWEIDDLGIYTYVNPKVYDILGYKQNEVWGKTIFDLMQKEEAQRMTKILGETALQQKPFILIENWFIHKNGYLSIVESSGVPFFDSDNQYRGCRGISRDITVRKQAEAEILKALEKEKELNELKSRFISMASHEFRTPLSTILICSDLIKCFGHKFSEKKKIEHLTKIQVQVKKVTHLLDDILLIGKAQAKAIKFHPSEGDLLVLSREVLSDISLAAGETHKFKLTCQGENSLVEMDEKLVWQIIRNLLENAVKYSPDGSTVNFEIKCEAEQATLKISDRGIGIPASEQPRLFEIFHRASNVGTISGTGLGLAIVKEAVELHGGSIAIESEEGMGTTCTVCIPRIQHQAETNPPSFPGSRLGTPGG